MRYRILFLVLVISQFSIGLSAGELKWQNFDIGLKEAKRTNKKILVDVYTD